MKVTLEVLASITIKRKKPWPGLSWIGKEKEKLFLLDKNRISILYLSDGKTKKKISKINHLLKNVAVLHVTKDGSYLVGLLFSGDLFVWHKDTDSTWSIEGLPELIVQGSYQKRFPAFSKPLLFASEKMDKILVINRLTQIFIWESCESFREVHPKQNHLSGKWFAIYNSSNIPTPAPDSKEATVAAVFFQNPVVGDSCLCSFIFACDDRICITSLHLHWSEPVYNLSLNSPSFEVNWCILNFTYSELGSGCIPVKHKGYFVAKYSHDGLILAVAVNQKNAFNSKLLFISPFTEAVVAADLKGCGVKNPRNSNKRYYRIADMAWTFNNAFLICITHQGSFCIFTRLGELILISTEGCKMDLGPNYFLNLHPLIIIRTNSTGDANQEQNADQASVISSLSEETVLKQHFSVATHPSLPILVTSDGYLVTCIKFPSAFHTVERVMEMLVIDSKLALASLQDEVKLTEDSLNILDSSVLNITDASVGYLDQLSSTVLEKNSEKVNSKLSLWNSTEESIAGSEESDYTNIQTNLFANWDSSILKAESGKILFGGPEEDLDIESRSKTFNLLENKQVQQRLECTVNYLFAAWGMAATESGIWNEKWELLAANICSSFGKLFAIIIGNNSGLNSDRTVSSLNPSSFSTENVLMKCLDILIFNVLHPNMLVFGVKLINYFAKSIILKCQKIVPEDAVLDYLWLAYNLMKKAECKLAAVYEWKLSQKAPCHMIYDLSTATYYSYQFHNILKPTSNNLKKSLCKDINGIIYIQKKLSRNWKYLYHLLLKKIKPNLQSGNCLDNCLLLLCKFQRKLQELNIPLKTKSHHKNEGNDLYLQGHHQEALTVWEKEIQNILKAERISRANRKKLTNRLHAVLYCLLRSSKLKEGLLMVDSLIKGSYLSSSNEHETSFMGLKTHFLTKLPGLQLKPIRKIMLTLGRFMAAYFLNNPLVIYPPYSPKELPLLMEELSFLSEYITLSRNSFHSLVASTNLADVWVPQIPLNLFMVSGSLVEAVEYAMSLGDWKVAFIISVAYENLIYSDKAHNKRPGYSDNHLEHLNPKNIMLGKLKKLVGLSDVEDNIDETSCKAKSIQGIEMYEQLTKTLEDHFLTSVLCGIDSVPYLMVKLVEKLKTVVKRLPLTIPQDFYVPAPPCYCPQNKEVDVSNSAVEEGKTREDIFELTHLILSVLRASHLTLVCVVWYSKYLINIHENVDNLDSLHNKFLENFEMYEETETALAFLAKNENNSDLLILLHAFRDFCILNWLLHLRDNLELEFRKLWNISDFTGLNQEEKIQQIEVTFTCAHQLLPFCEFMSWEPELHQIIFTIVQESPHSLKIIEMFSKCFPDLTTLPSEVDFRLQNLLKQWRNVYSITGLSEDGSSGHQFGKKKKKTLSVHYLEQCQKELKRIHSASSKNVELNIFSSEENHEQKSRISEFDLTFTDFLSIFFDVTMLKYISNLTTPMQIPLVLCNKKQVMKQELDRLSNVAVSTPSPSRINQLLNQSQKEEISILFSNSCKVDAIKAETFTGKHKLKSKKHHTRSLFRSSSLADLSRSRSALPITVFSSCKKTKSLENIIRARNYLPDGQPSTKSKLAKSNSFSHNSEATSHLHPKQNRSAKSITRRLSLLELNELSSIKPSLHLSKSSSLQERDFDFRTEFQEHINLLTWLTRWNSKSHPHSDFAVTFTDRSRVKSQMRLNLPLNLLLMSMWLLKHNFHKTYSGKQFNHPSNTVAKKHSEKHLLKTLDHNEPQLITNSKRSELNFTSSAKSSPRGSCIGEPKQRLIFRSTSEDTFESESQNSLDVASLASDVYFEKENTSRNIKHRKKHSAKDEKNPNKPAADDDFAINFKTKNTKSKTQSSRGLAKKKDTSIIHSHLNEQLNEQASTLNSEIENYKIQEKELSEETSVSEIRKESEVTLEQHQTVKQKNIKKKNDVTENFQQTLKQEVERKEYDYTEQLQQTVKEEVGKLIEVQQQNMIAVITALEDSLSKIHNSLPKVFKENTHSTVDKQSGSTTPNPKTKKISSILKNPVSSSINQQVENEVQRYPKQTPFIETNSSKKSNDSVFPLKHQESATVDTNEFFKIQENLRKAETLTYSRLSKKDIEMEAKHSKSADNVLNKSFHEEIKNNKKEKKKFRKHHDLRNNGGQGLQNAFKGFSLLKVDPSYLHNSLTADYNFSEYPNKVPRFLRLPAEKEIETQNQNLASLEEDKIDSKDLENRSNNSRLRGGGGKKQRKPLPLLKLSLDPCKPAAEIQPSPNKRTRNPPTLIHTGLPLLQIDKELFVQKPKKVVGCHVCDGTNKCPEHGYVQNLLKDYWQCLQHERYHTVPDVDHEYQLNLIQRPQPDRAELVKDLEFSREKSKDNRKKVHRLLHDNYTTSASEENLTKMCKHEELGEVSSPVRRSKSEISMSQLTTDSETEKVPKLKEPGEVSSQSQVAQPVPNFAEMQYKTVFELEKARQFLESLQRSSLSNKTSTAVQTENAISSKSASWKTRQPGIHSELIENFHSSTCLETGIFEDKEFSENFEFQRIKNQPEENSNEHKDSYVYHKDGCSDRSSLSFHSHANECKSCDTLKKLDSLIECIKRKIICEHNKEKVEKNIQQPQTIQDQPECNNLNVLSSNCKIATGSSPFEFESMLEYPTRHHFISNSSLPFDGLYVEVDHSCEQKDRNVEDSPIMPKIKAELLTKPKTYISKYKENFIQSRSSAISSRASPDCCKEVSSNEQSSEKEDSTRSLQNTTDLISSPRNVCSVTALQKETCSATSIKESVFSKRKKTSPKLSVASHIVPKKSALYNSIKTCKHQHHSPEKNVMPSNCENYRRKSNSSHSTFNSSSSRTLSQDKSICQSVEMINISPNKNNDPIYLSDLVNKKPPPLSKFTEHSLMKVSKNRAGSQENKVQSKDKSHKKGDSNLPSNRRHHALGSKSLSIKKSPVHLGKNKKIAMQKSEQQKFDNHMKCDVISKSLEKQNLSCSSQDVSNLNQSCRTKGNESEDKLKSSSDSKHNSKITNNFKREFNATLSAQASNNVGQREYLKPKNFSNEHSHLHGNHHNCSLEMKTQTSLNLLNILQTFRDSVYEYVKITEPIIKDSLSFTESNKHSQVEMLTSAAAAPEAIRKSEKDVTKPSSPVQVPTLKFPEQQRNDFQAKTSPSRSSSQELKSTATKDVSIATRSEIKKVNKEVQTVEENKPLFSYEKLDSTLFYPPQIDQQINKPATENLDKNEEMKVAPSQFLSVIDLDDGEVDNIIRTSSNIPDEPDSSLTKFDMKLLVSEDAANLSRKRRGEMDSHENQSLRIKQANISTNSQESSQRLFIDEAQQQLKDIKERIKTVEKLDKNLQEEFKDSKELFQFKYQKLQDETHGARGYRDNGIRSVVSGCDLTTQKSWLTDLKSELHQIEENYRSRTIANEKYSKNHPRNDFASLKEEDAANFDYKSDASPSSSSSLENFLNNIKSHKKTKSFEADPSRRASISKLKIFNERSTSETPNDYYEKDMIPNNSIPAFIPSQSRNTIIDDFEKESEYPESCGFSVKNINHEDNYADSTYQPAAVRSRHSGSQRRNCMLQPRNSAVNSVPYYDSEHFHKYSKFESNTNSQSIVPESIGMNLANTEDWNYDYQDESKRRDASDVCSKQNNAGKSINPNTSAMKSARFQSGNDTNTSRTSNKLKEELFNAKLSLAQETSDASEMLSARTPSGTLSQKDRAVARKIQKDAHHKLRMQEACQLMDELISDETELLLTPEYTTVASRSSRLHAGISQNKIENSSKNSSSIKSTPLNSAARLRATKRINRALGIHSSAQEHPRTLEARHTKDLRDFDKTSRIKESSNLRDDDTNIILEPNNSSISNRDELGLETIKDHQMMKLGNKGISSTSFGNTYTKSGYRFDRTYTFQKTETVSTIPEVTEEEFTINPTSEKSSNNILQHFNSRNPSNNNRFKVRMTRTAVLRKRLASAKLNPSEAAKKHKNMKTFAGTRIKNLDSSSSAVAMPMKTGKTSGESSDKQMQNIDLISDGRETKEFVNSPLNSSLTSTPSLWEVPEDIKKIIYNNEDHYEISSNYEDDYTQVINTDVLAQISDTHESIGEYINWDEVDKLIESFK